MWATDGIASWKRFQSIMTIKSHSRSKSPFPFITGRFEEAANRFHAAPLTFCRFQRCGCAASLPERPAYHERRLSGLTPRQNHNAWFLFLFGILLDFHTTVKKAFIKKKTNEVKCNLFYTFVFNITKRS